uniref:BMP n=1 Tax=Schmidtea mediterranea TaxID=79327 RepID=A8SLH3_SCHMD|nr:BMP [Schmidtea mediterranea]
MQKLIVVNIQILCCFIFKLTQIIDAKDSFYGKRFGSQNNNPSEKVRSNLQKMLLSNMGLQPDDVVDSEKYAELSEKLPHFVPDFMKSLYVKSRYNLFNFSVNIEGKPVHLGPIEIIHCQRLRNIQTWSSVGIHKLVFKSSVYTNDNHPLARELRLNRRLFPKILQEPPNNKSNEMHVIMMIFNEHFQLIKEKPINSKSFMKHGWISVDISEYVKSSVFYIKMYGFWRNRSSHTSTDLKFLIQKMNQLYLYYANIVTFYGNKAPLPTYNQEESTIPKDENIRLKRVKRDKTDYIQSLEDDCQRYSLIVTFKEVGWSKWIIAPQNYNAYYCKGNCPYPLSDNFNATNHAIIQLLIHGLKDISIPKPCCVPYNLRPETLLYLNREGDALLREFKDMSVSSCSCH